MTRVVRLILASALLPLFAITAGGQEFDPFQTNALFGMAKAGNYAAVEDRLNQGDSPNSIGENGATALIVVSQIGRCDIAMLLLKRQARTDIKDREGNTALIYAAQRGNLPCLEALIAARADVNAINRQGESALMLAARSGKVDAIKALIQAKADVTATDFSGATALSYAEGARQRQAAEALRAAGARK
ncbi:MAG: ankyrin repeat domain-containing protein [Alphaproteobacteria bacterium]